MYYSVGMQEWKKKTCRNYEEFNDIHFPILLLSFLITLLW